MENLKQELLKLCKANVNPQIEEDSEFYRRYFLSDEELEDFAVNNKLNQCNGIVSGTEQACDCEIIYDYEGSNPNRQFGDQEIIFN